MSRLTVRHPGLGKSFGKDALETQPYLHHLLDVKRYPGFFPQASHG